MKPARAFSAIAALLVVGAVAGVDARPVRIGQFVEIPFGVARGHLAVTAGVREQRDGRSTAVAPRRTPTEVWSAAIGDGRMWPPLVTRDGVVFAVTQRRVVRLDRRGDEQASAEVPGVAAPPSLTPDGGLLLVGANTLRRLTAGLRTEAELDVRAVQAASPLVLADGSAIVPTGGALERVDVGGGEVFRVAVPTRTVGPAARAGRGRVVFTTRRHLIIVGDDGRVLRRTELRGAPIAGPAVTTDGTMYVVTNAGDLVAFEADGRRRARIHLADRLRVAAGSTLAIGLDGMVRVARGPDGVSCHGPDGTERWHARGVQAWVGITVDANGVTLVPTVDGNLVALDAEGAELWRVPLEGRPNTPPVLGVGGMVLLGLSDGTLRAFR